jgi:hypothetical protein
VTGYASVFNSLSGDFRGWRERVRPGAFAASLANGGYNGDVFAISVMTQIRFWAGDLQAHCKSLKMTPV